MNESLEATVSNYLAAEGIVHGPEELASLGSLLETHSLRPCPCHTESEPTRQQAPLGDS